MKLYRDETIMKIILASSSPRRRELLAMAGFTFDVIPADIDESASPNTPPDELVAFLSEKKAMHIWHTRHTHQNANNIIIGADTIVAIDGLILGKPSDEADAFLMLKRLQGRAHTVYTGVTVVAKGKADTFVEHTKVYMRSLTDKEIHDYIQTGEGVDKAGAYGIQERGAVLIERVEGDYFTVVGLPLCRLNLALQKLKEL